MKNRDKEIRKVLNKNLGWCTQDEKGLIIDQFIKAINKIIDEVINEKQG